jgi:hypothetical protein
MEVKSVRFGKFVVARRFRDQGRRRAIAGRDVDRILVRDRHQGAATVRLSAASARAAGMNSGMPPDLNEGLEHCSATAIRLPISHSRRVAAMRHHTAHKGHLHDQLSVSDWITLSLRQAIDEASGKSADRHGCTGIGRFHCAVRRLVRHRVGHLSRAGFDRHVGTGQHRQSRRSGRRSADHDRARPGCRDSRHLRL